MVVLGITLKSGREMLLQLKGHFANFSTVHLAIKLE